MQLPYRPKFLPHARESGAARIRRRLGQTRTPFAPEPHVAPAAIHGDATRIYTPGPVLIDRDGVYLFHDGPAPSWPVDRGPPSEPMLGPAYAPPIPAWKLVLEGCLLIFAIVCGGVVLVHLP